MVSSACVTYSTFVPLTRITTGTCVIDIGMLYIYWPGKITEIKPLFTRTDEATFNMIVNAAINVVSKCVESRPEPVAGWIATGKSAHARHKIATLQLSTVYERLRYTLYS